MRLIRYTYPTYRNPAPVLNRFAVSPWSGLDSEIDRLFTAALSDLGSPVTSARLPADLYEDKANTYLRAELPGVSRDDINVEVADGVLTITAVRKTPAAEGQPEQSFTLSRSITLSDSVQADQVSAAYENGVLTVTLPKRAEAKPKAITVAVK